MPLYEYRCRECDARFELRRPMDDADAPVTCPTGHEAGRRLLSVFAAAGRATSSSSDAPAAPMAGGCGAGCACAH